MITHKTTVDVVVFQPETPEDCHNIDCKKCLYDNTDDSAMCLELSC